MIKTITAEFQSFDQAEYASRVIKSHNEVELMKIRSNNVVKNEYNPFGHPAFDNDGVNMHFPIPAFYNSVQFPVIYGEFQSIVSDYVPSEPSADKTVTLEIKCRSAQMDYISSELTAFGALNIKK